MNDFVWRQESGKLVVKDKFPIISLHFGDLSDDGEAAYITLGPLVCTDGKYIILNIK